jgi:hypothetical protein
MAQQSDTQVWTAPYTNDPAQLAATGHVIADIQGPNGTYLPGDSLAFGGLYAVAAGSGPSAGYSSIYVVRASDGAVTLAPTAGDYSYWSLVHVTHTELWAVMGEQGGPASGAAFVRAQLGPWTGGD